MPMQQINFYKNEDTSFQRLEVKGKSVLHSRFSSFEKYDFDTIEETLVFFKNEEKEIIKEGFKIVKMNSVALPSALTTFDEVITCFNQILEKEALFSVFNFLKLVDKNTKSLFVKELKLYRKHLSEFEENKGNSWSRVGSDIQMDIISLCAMALMNKTDVKPWTEVYLLLKISQFSYIEEVLNHFKPTWLNDFILEKTIKSEWGRIEYQQLIHLENNGFLNYNQELFALCLSNTSFWKQQSISDSSFIFKNEKTYQRDIPLLFEYPSNLQNYTTIHIEGEKQEKAWSLIFQRLIEQGKLDRFFVLEKCVEIQLKNWNNLQLSFFRTLFENLQPSKAELLQLQNQLFLLLPIANKTVYNFAIKHIKKIAVEKDFKTAEFIDWSASLLSNFDAKTSIISILQLFDKFLKNKSELRCEILLKATEVFIVNEYDVQQRAATLLMKYAKETDDAVVENLMMYKSQMLGSISKELAFLIGDSEEEQQFHQETNEHLETTKQEIIGKEIPQLSNWDDIFYAIGTAINSSNPIDFEIVVNAFLTQKSIFPSDFEDKLKIYLKTAREQYKGKAARYDLTVLLNLMLNNGAKKVDFSAEEESNKLLLIRKHLIDYIFYAYNSGNKISLLSMPTHLPCFITANVFLERLVEYQTKNIIINPYDFMISINRLIPEFDEESHLLIGKLSGNYKQLFEILSDKNEESALTKANELLSKNSVHGNRNLFHKALNFLGKQNEKLAKVIDDKTMNNFEMTEKSFYDCAIMTARLRFPFTQFDALQSTIYKNIPFAMTDCKAKLKNESVIYKYVDYEKITQYENKIELYSDFVTSNYTTYFYYSFNIKNPQTHFTDYWDYAYQNHDGISEYDIKTYFGLMPFYTEPIFAMLYNNEYRRASFFTEATANEVLKTMLQPQFKMGYFSNWYLACSQFSDKKEIRLLSTEVILHLIEYQKLNEKEFIDRITELYQSKYGTIQRFIENIAILKDVSALHNKFLSESIEHLLVAFAKEEKPPTNTKKLVEILYDIKVKSNEKLSTNLQNALEKWKQNATLKKLIENLLNL